MVMVAGHIVRKVTDLRAEIGKGHSSEGERERPYQGFSRIFVGVF